ncbi:MAG: hypothetical protein EOO43_09165 [Flavobacterium sp.]|nr:MAG: hypothetical protein EOO43_09165 [Flavobacterium sp.]
MYLLQKLNFVLKVYPSQANFLLVKTLNAKNTPGTQYSEFTSNNNTWSDPASVSAHYNASIAYDYYKNNHGRNSINFFKLTNRKNHSLILFLYRLYVRPFFKMVHNSPCVILVEM